MYLIYGFYGGYSYGRRHGIRSYVEDTYPQRSSRPVLENKCIKVTSVNHSRHERRAVQAR